MRSKKIRLTNFSRALYSESPCIRPDNQHDLVSTTTALKQHLARGAGLSYNDSCLNRDKPIIDMQRFNHFIDFDPETGILICQANLNFKDVFLIHPDYIPPVIPGTLKATLAGGIAHDIHGKNNPDAGSFGHHLLWIELLIRNRIIRCGPNENQDLFHATIAGLGLTGIILRIALRLKRASRFVQAEYKTFTSMSPLIEYMSTKGLGHDYQAAWVDLLHSEPRAILSLATHCETGTLTGSTVVPEQTVAHNAPKIYRIPKLPFKLLNRWDMTLFNKFYFNNPKSREKISLVEFNNPLDRIDNWNNVYGSKGLIQFQALFPQDKGEETLKRLLAIIKTHSATPTLATLKLFLTPGTGLISFCKPGFTITIDFINNEEAQHAVRAMNQLITELNGHIYLAKDLFLTSEQYQKMYARHEEFKTVLHNYQPVMCSDLAQRLGIIQ